MKTEYDRGVHSAVTARPKGPPTAGIRRPSANFFQQIRLAHSITGLGYS